MSHRIQILPSAEIDKDRWDGCVSDAENGLLYSRSAYLDGICAGWYGLVVDAYTSVMAIPVKKKYGICYAYIPPFVQQLGLTGITNTPLLTQVIKEMAQLISYGDLHLNFSNHPGDADTRFTTRTNLVLALSGSIDTIRTAYRQDVKENIRKAQSRQLVFGHATTNDAIRCFQQEYGSRIANTGEKDYRQFGELAKKLQAEGKCFVRAVTDASEQLLAIGLFLSDHKRIYHIMNTTLPEGRTLFANHYLLDKVLEEFAGSGRVFDMEGSDLPGVKQFYKGFGAVNQPYYHYHFNHLPWPLRFLKR